MMQDESLSFLTMDDVAISLKISPLSVMKYIKRGQLKAYRIGRLIRIRRTDLEEFIQKQNTKA